MSTNIRYVHSAFINEKGKRLKYLHQEDVIAYIKECAATEETDVRNRLNKMAEELSK